MTIALKIMLDTALKWFFPYTCVLCQSHTNMNKDLCNTCSSKLPWINYYCQKCGIELPEIQSHCGMCLKQSPVYDRTVTLFRYELPISQFIIQLKFNQKLIYAKLFGQLLAAQIHKQGILPECILPVPLHPKRLRERGYNQSLELARTISKELSIPMDVNTCQRVRHTQSHSLISAKKRQINIKGAFELSKNLPFQHVALLDDVVTTGATINELSQLLRSNNVQKIDVWCVARTSGKIKDV